MRTCLTMASSDVCLASATAASAVRNWSKVIRRLPLAFTCDRPDTSLKHRTEQAVVTTKLMH